MAKNSRGRIYTIHYDYQVKALIFTKKDVHDFQYNMHDTVATTGYWSPIKALVHLLLRRIVSQVFVL